MAGRDPYYDAARPAGASTGSTPPTPRRGTQGTNTQNNNPNANHGQNPAPNRISRFDELGYDQADRVPGAAR